MAWTRRAAALAVALLSLFPLHRLLIPERNGPAAVDALARTEPSWGVTFWGALLVALAGMFGWVLARQGQRTGGGLAGNTPDHVGRVIGSLRGVLARTTPRAFAWAVAGVAAVFAGAVAIGLQRGLLTGVDEMATLIHARYLAAGMLGGSLPAAPEAWLIPNTLVTGRGWVSQYPPGHLLVWAAFVVAGLRWAAGPLLFGVMAGLVAASLERLLPPERRTHARVAALLLALSPFALLLAGGSPSHMTAGAAGALALYAAISASEGRRAWAPAAGLAVGVMVLARPWAGVLLGPVLTLGVWLERGGIMLVRKSVGWWIVGGIPCALLLFVYDGMLFGSPLTLGYEALYGPAHELGFHADPWSFLYGAREAVAYSASDVIQFGAMLLDTPVSLTLVAAIYLLLVPRLGAGVSVVAAWALIPVFGNALYWFHAPRMLFESAPAWILLAVLAAAQVHDRADSAIRAGVRWSAATTLLVAALVLVPGHIRSQRWTPDTLSRITVPEGVDGALVFVHAGWDERLASALQASGMRNDSIQAIVRRNDSCLLHEYAVARLAGVPPEALPPIDPTQTSAEAESMVTMRAPDLPVLRRRQGAGWSPECLSELGADRFGTVALAPLLWQGDLPGLERGRPMFVRDYGPARNETVRARFPGRLPVVFAYAPGGGPPQVVGYDAGMLRLWGPQAPR